DVLRRIRAINTEIPIVMITAVKDIKTVVDAMKLGASDYIVKPISIEELKIVIKNVLERQDLVKEVEFLRSKISEKIGFNRIIGRSNPMRKVLDMINRVSKSNSTILIRGESGTGKELVVNALHNLSPRKDKPYIKLNCAAIPETLLESELFGFEKGAFNVLVSENAKMVGELLTKSEVVRKFTFTGSTGVGKQLLAQCAPSIKRTSMELGGNAPFIIFANADLDEAVSGLMGAKFRNGGQTCVAANRIFVQRSVLDKVLEKLAEKVAALKVANGLAKDCDIGPLIYPQAKQKVQQLVADAITKGAKRVGVSAELSGNYYAPVILTGVTAEMDIYHQEVFGPVASIIAFDDEAEVLAMANDVPFGLAAYFYSQDIKQIYRVSEALEYGMVGINEGLISNPVAPFGGVKQSGLGREGGHQGLDEYLEEKYVCMKV
ncbi:hypothetical protein LCGC14_2605520, partial [marine sediment metagenome]